MKSSNSTVVYIAQRLIVHPNVIERVSTATADVLIKKSPSLSSAEIFAVNKALGRVLKFPLDIEEERDDIAPFQLKSHCRLAPYQPLEQGDGRSSFAPNYELLLLPDIDTLQLAGKCHEIEDGLWFYFQVLTSLELPENEVSDQDEDWRFMITHILPPLLAYFQRHFCDLQLFFLDTEWEHDINAYSLECLTCPIEFLEKDGELQATYPPLSAFGLSVTDTDFVVSYLSSLSSLQKLMGNDELIIELTHFQEMPTFKLAKNLWIDHLIAYPTDEFSVNRYWWTEEKRISDTQTKIASVEGFVQWLNDEAITGLYYNAFVRHADGAYVCYTFTGFNGRERRVEFQVSAFDPEGFSQWLDALIARVSITIAQSGAYEYDWHWNSFYLDRFRPIFPEKPSPGYSLILLPCDSALDGQPQGVDLSRHAHLISINKHLIFKGLLTPPLPFSAAFFTQGGLDLHGAFDEAKNLVSELLEDGIEPTVESSFVHRLIMESHLKQIDQQVIMTMLAIIELPQDEMDALIVSEELRLGYLSDPQILTDFNVAFPGMSIEQISFIPQFSE
jgi:hypothetical protein